MMTMFVQLQQGTLPPYKLNFGVINLSPKKEDEVQIQQYRTISLFNGVQLFFAEVGTNCIKEIAHKVIRPT